MGLHKVTTQLRRERHSVTDLKIHWVCVTKYRNWEWLNYNKSAQILAQDTANGERNLDWAEIRFDFTSPNGSVQGAYEARVEVCDRVMSAINSGNEQVLQEVKQYRVSRLTLIKSNGV